MVEITDMIVFQLANGVGSLIHEYLFAGSELKDAATLFPKDFHPNLRGMLIKILAAHHNEWRAIVIATQISAPQLVNFGELLFVYCCAARCVCVCRCPLSLSPSLCLSLSHTLYIFVCMTYKCVCVFLCVYFYEKMCVWREREREKERAMCMCVPCMLLTCTRCVDWRVDVKQSSNYLAHMNVPTVFVEMKVVHPMLLSGVLAPLWT